MCMDQNRNLYLRLGLQTCDGGLLRHNIRGDVWEISMLREMRGRTPSPGEILDNDKIVVLLEDLHMADLHMANHEIHRQFQLSV